MKSVTVQLIVFFAALSASHVDSTPTKTLFFSDFCIIKNGSLRVELDSTTQLKSSVVIQANRGFHEQKRGSNAKFQNLCTILLVPPTEFDDIVIAVREISFRIERNCSDNLTISDNYGNRHIMYYENSYDKEERNTSTFRGRTSIELRTGPRVCGEHQFVDYGQFSLTVTSYRRFPCSPHEFECSNGRCIADGLTCNGHNNCGDRSDEVICNSTVLPRCPPRNFQCLDGRCYDKQLICEDITDTCNDELEEAYCNATTTTETPTCLSEYHQCLNGYCVPESDLCDGFNDCGDWSDEGTRGNCTTRLPCAPGGFRCANGRCILARLLCTGFGYSYCGDKSDLEDCTTTTSTPTTPKRCWYWEFTCDNGRCVDKYFVCNGRDDCGDGSDEHNCQTTLKPCYYWQFHCANGDCISSSYVCDGDNDCGDGSDELDCPTTTLKPCYDGQFQCANGECIYSSYVCNGDNDCGDGSDELNCPTTTSRYCYWWEFRCDNGDCIQKTRVCNGYNECGDWSDERGCTTTTPNPCYYWQFHCANGRCIYSSYVCNGDNDCGDGSDELYCPTRLSSAAIFGIVIMCVIMFFFLLCGLVQYRKRKNERTTANANLTSPPYTISHSPPPMIHSSQQPRVIPLSPLPSSGNQETHDLPPDYSSLFP